MVFYFYIPFTLYKKWYQGAKDHKSRKTEKGLPILRIPFHAIMEIKYGTHEDHRLNIFWRNIFLKNLKKFLKTVKVQIYSTTSFF